ncbi:MAG: aminobutyraldehyde dehydrogenase [Actinobacteria bacterium]|nr:aminobutyraldehyde dehydrogenase [Actinomycetota bacterium]
MIDGKLEPGSSETWPVVNPADGQPIVEVPLGTAADVDRAVAAARAALPAWRKRTPGERAAVLVALADILDANAETLSQLESLNVGKPLAVSREEIPVASDTLRFMAAAIRTVQTPAAEEYVTDNLSILRREPVGVVAGITPWNYPLMTAIWKIAPALAAGNTMVLKPSELTPLTTIVFVEMAQEVLPPGVLNLVLGTGPVVGQALSAHPEVDLISLTGSIASGVAISEQAAANLKHVHLELGGKAPVVVFDDADLDAAVEAVRVMGFWNTGQECGAATRVLVDRRIHDELVAKLREAIGAIRVGGPEQGEGVEVGPLVSEIHRDRVDALVKAAIGDGATVETGGGPADVPGFFYEPTLLTQVPADSEALRKEIFGPVVTVETFDGEREAIELANDSNYGLAASIWTEGARRSLRVSDALDYGTVWVNSHLTLATEMPWVGFKMSGRGRELSTYAIEEFSRTKHVMVAK